MKSYVYEHVRLDEDTHIITRYTVAENFWWSVGKFILFVCVVWPLEIFVVWPAWFLLRLILFILEMALRGLWWLIRLPFCKLFAKRLPKF